MVMKSSSTNIDAGLRMLLQVQKGDPAHIEAETTRLLRGTKDGAASDNVLHEFVNWSDATTLKTSLSVPPFSSLPLEANFEMKSHPAL